MNKNAVAEHRGTPQEPTILRWTPIVAVITAVAGLFGCTGIASGAAGIAKTFFIGSLVLCGAVSLLALLGFGAVT